MRKFRSVLQVLPRLSAVLAVYVVIICLFAGFGPFLFNMKDFGEDDDITGDYFTNFRTSAWSLLIAMSTSSYPDQVMAGYRAHREFSLFFFLFMTIGSIIMLNLILVVVFVQFQKASLLSVDMQRAVQAGVDAATVFVAAAAVADWRPASQADRKIKKDGSGAVPALAFVENPDILAGVAAGARAQSGALYCVGFAAESHDLLAHAQAKRARKGVPLLVGNIGPDTFGRDDNALLLVDAQGSTELPRADKLSLARQLVAEIARRRG